MSCHMSQVNASHTTSTTEALGLTTRSARADRHSMCGEQAPSSMLTSLSLLAGSSLTLHQYQAMRRRHSQLPCSLLITRSARTGRNTFCGEQATLQCVVTHLSVFRLHCTPVTMPGFILADMTAAGQHTSRCTGATFSPGGGRQTSCRRCITGAEAASNLAANEPQANSSQVCSECIIIIVHLMWPRGATSWTSQLRFRSF
jgi:hypothetical protein